MTVDTCDAVTVERQHRAALTSNERLIEEFVSIAPGLTSTPIATRPVSGVGLGERWRT